MLAPVVMKTGWSTHPQWANQTVQCCRLKAKSAYLPSTVPEIFSVSSAYAD